MNDKIKKYLYLAAIAILLALLIVFLVSRRKDNNMSVDTPTVSAPPIQVVEPTSEEDIKEQKRETLILKYVDVDASQRNIYEHDSFKAGSLEGISDEEIKNENYNFIEGTAYFVSDEGEYNTLIEKKVLYDENNLSNLISTYTSLLSPHMYISVKETDNAAFLNFTSSDFQQYLKNNPSFYAKYARKNTSDVSLTSEGEALVLQGYYETVKKNFPNIEFVYFKFGGAPWEIFPGRTHFGLLFLEEGQTLPKIRPAELYDFFQPEMYETDGFFGNYSGDRMKDGTVIPVEPLVPINPPNPDAPVHIDDPTTNETEANTTAPVNEGTTSLP